MAVAAQERCALPSEGCDVEDTSRRVCRRWSPRRACVLRGSAKSVVEAIARAKGSFTAQQLHDWLRGRRLERGLTTVYRTLEILSDMRSGGASPRPEPLRGVRRRRSQHSHTIVCYALWRRG